MVTSLWRLRWKPRGTVLIAIAAVAVCIIASMCYSVVLTGRQDRALVAAVERGDTLTGLALLQAGANPNARVNMSAADSAWTYISDWVRTRFGLHPDVRSLSEPLLTTAIENENTALFQALLAHGADVNVKNAMSMSPLLMTVMQNDVPAVTVLLDRHAKINVRGVDGTTPLWASAYGGHDRMVQLLIKRGADTNAKGVDGSTPLMAAATRGSDSIVWMLIHNHADVNAKDRAGNTALKFARLCGNSAVARRLTEAGATR